MNNVAKEAVKGQLDEFLNMATPGMVRAIIIFMDSMMGKKEEPIT